MLDQRALLLQRPGVKVPLIQAGSGLVRITRLLCQSHVRKYLTIYTTMPAEGSIVVSVLALDVAGFGDIVLKARELA